MSKKHPKPGHDRHESKIEHEKAEHKPSHHDTHVHGSIEVNFSDKLVGKHEAEQQETTAREKTQLRIAVATVIGVFLYTSVALWQGCSMKTSTDATKKAADAAEGATRLAQQTFEVSQQASVTLGNKDGVVAELRKSPNPKLKDGLVIYFQNSGHMPAKLKWGVNDWFTENPIVMLPDAPRFVPMQRTRNKKTGAISEHSSTDGSIGGEAVREVAVGYLPAGFVDYLTKTNKGFKLNGVYEYCDELGRYACRDFSLAYQHSPFGTFRIMKDDVCIDRSYLGNTNPAPDEELLPLCVPRNAPPFPNR